MNHLLDIVLPGVEDLYLQSHRLGWGPLPLHSQNRIVVRAITEHFLRYRQLPKAHVLCKEQIGRGALQRTKMPRPLAPF